MIYTVGGTKGGSGKTTFSVNLAVTLSHIGHDVLLDDADDQGTATDFTDMRSESRGGDVGYTAVQLLGKAVGPQVQKLASKYQDIVIDVGGRDTNAQRMALLVSDVFVCPFKPRSYDMWTIEKVVEVIGEVKTINQDLQSYAFLNMTDPRGSDNAEAAEQLAEFGELLYADAPIGHRKAFANAGAYGQGIIEYKPKDAKAIAEFLALVSKVTDLKASVINQITGNSVPAA